MIRNNLIKETVDRYIKISPLFKKLNSEGFIIFNNLIKLSYQILKPEEKQWLLSGKQNITYYKTLSDITDLCSIFDLDIKSDSFLNNIGYFSSEKELDSFIEKIPMFQVNGYQRFINTNTTFLKINKKKLYNFFISDNYSYVTNPKYFYNSTNCLLKSQKTINYDLKYYEYCPGTLEYITEDQKNLNLYKKIKKDLYKFYRLYNQFSFKLNLLGITLYLNKDTLKKSDINYIIKFLDNEKL